ncbi:MATE family efflux transporter [Treponema sp.]|uniref:MATE family efflux transporter n=1 Tax=Treponema sp. TaxID=166 RepID=UPI0025FFFB70|nr:MATE family efflux transporter [Treponema sp.]MCR5217050.1 MATE family efflux transporter [Treponema sp.]
MSDTTLFTSGRIAPRLLRFALPVLGALFLQSFYGAVDLLIVGQFGASEDVSAVATGTMMMQTITFIITGLAMGTTIQMGQALGAGKNEKAANIVGTSIIFFTILALLVTVLMIFLTRPFAILMQTPKEAFDKTLMYVHICSAGTVFISGYNMLGSVFRGMGDSKTPLMTVLVACIMNIFGDLLFVVVFDMAASGAALATVIAQAFSVIFCLILVRKKGLPFKFGRNNIKWDSSIVRMVCKTGAPISLQDGLVTVSFLVIAAIINGLGLIASAGVGVAERVCGFIMLVPSAFSQSLSAFVAQNVGAGEYGRARKALYYSIIASLACGLFMGSGAFFKGDLLAAVFTKEAPVIEAAHSYLKAYAIDTLFVSFLFCFIGYFNGCGKTKFVMIQGLIGAFLVRIPVSFLVSKTANPTLFKIGLATPCSTVVQIILCGIYFVIVERKIKSRELKA